MDKPMQKRNFALPGNPRTQPRELVPYFGYDNLFGPVAEVELAGLKVMAELGFVTEEEMALLTPQIIDRIRNVPTTYVDQVEREVTKHDIRAWVLNAQGIIQAAYKGTDKEALACSLARWIHVPYTSYDALDSARILTFKRVHEKVLSPALYMVISFLAAKVREFAFQLQIGRTHGRHALPITVGFWLATILSRILTNLQEMERYEQKLVGKISGAVGAKNAQVGLGIEERCGGESFEERVLGKLDLKPALISTQILPPEPLAYYLFSCVMMSAALGQLGRDCRNLMRQEIEEVLEPKESGDVGSSTMAHKINPWRFEGLESEWLKTKNEFGKIMDGMNSDAQRDMVGGRLARDYPTIVVILVSQVNILLQKDRQTGIPFLQRMTIDRGACQRNFQMSAHLVLAEPIYIALLMGGYKGDAHKLINDELAPLARKEKRLLIEVVKERGAGDPEIAEALKRIPSKMMSLLRHPEEYIGNAVEQAIAIADLAESVAKK